jgi:hypothetical protein
MKWLKEMEEKNGRRGRGERVQISIVIESWGPLGEAGLGRIEGGRKELKR